MNYKLSDKIKMLMCKIFGHKPTDNGWSYNGGRHNVCKRCGHIYSKAEEEQT